MAMHIACMCILRSIVEATYVNTQSGIIHNYKSVHIQQPYTSFEITRKATGSKLKSIAVRIPEDFCGFPWIPIDID